MLCFVNKIAVLFLFLHSVFFFLAVLLVIYISSRIV
jgi:hypothetical protein